MKHILTIIFTCLLTFSLPSQEVIDLFIWAGQSNARGREGDAAQYPADPNGYDPQIRLDWTLYGSDSSNGWVTMGPQDGQTNPNQPTQYFGPEVTFSRKLKEAGFNPAIFKFTEGGSSIYGDWLQPGDGGILDTMVVDLQNAILDLETQGHTVNVNGFVWIQGESDADTYQTSQLFEDRLQTIIDHLRIDIVNNSELPVILGVDEQITEVCTNPMVLNAHEDIANDDTNIRFSSMYGFPKKDKTHLLPVGLIAQGEHLYDIYDMLINENTPLEDCVLDNQHESISLAEKSSWGQSFKAECYGYLSEISFEAATDVNSPFTVTIGNGADCEATIMTTEVLPEIVNGTNTITLKESLYLNKEHSYFINIVSDNGTLWKVKQSDTNNVYGLLRTYTDLATDLNPCREYFSDNDMAFSAKIMNNFEGTLPVELVDFNAFYNEGKVVIDWLTQSEINNSHFIIQRSYDGIEFEDIDVVVAKEDPSVVNEYNYVDQSFDNHYSTIYYRLVQVDHDGNTEVFMGDAVEIPNDSSSIAVYPNIVTQGEYLSLQGNISQIEIYDVLGHLLYKQEEIENNNQMINTNQLNKGLLIVVLNKKTVQKIFVK